MPLSPNVYQRIVTLAWTHILKGGGVVPDDGGSEVEESIGAVADLAFKAKADVATFDKSIAKLEYEQREAIHTAAWSMLTAYQDAAFTFGAAVGLQLTSRGGKQLTSRGGKKGEPPSPK